MLVISDGAALERAQTLLPDTIRDLLLLRRDQLGGEIDGHARFVVFEPGDRPCWLEDAMGFSVFQNIASGAWHGDPDFTPGWEWIEDHGHCWEMAFQLTDDLTHAVIVVNAPGVCRRVADLCRAYALQSA
ncbi:MAG: hypothetical protein H0T82_11010 [Sphingomonas sp.]|nr:hypothetical protein [Sphingomonas sp.]